MKTLITLLLSISLMGTRAQLTLEHSYPTELGLSYLYPAQNEIIYYAHETTINQLRIYNSSHTLIKTINVPVSGNSYTAVYYPSKTLYDTDNDFEYIVYTGDNNGGVLGYNLYLYDESGIQLAHIPNATLNGIFNTPTGAKMMVRKMQSGSTTYAIIGSEVYSLPGQLYYSEIVTGVTENDNTFHTGMAYPNPANNTISIPYQFKTNGGNVAIYSIDGKQVDYSVIDGTQGIYELNTSNIAPGVYQYNLSNGVSGKFVIQ
jgi:hypothetical protein